MQLVKEAAQMAGCRILLYPAVFNTIGQPAPSDKMIKEGVKRLTKWYAKLTITSEESHGY